MRRIAKHAALRALQVSGGLALLRFGHRAALLVLAYHGVDEPGDAVVNGDGFHVAPDRFRWQLSALRRHFRVIPLRDAVAAMRAGNLPPRAACVTFDDGYANNFTQAAPILSELGVPACFFLTSGYLDGTHAPWWYQVRAAVAAAAGDVWSSGSHRLAIRSVEDRRRAVAVLEAEGKSLAPGARADWVAGLTGGGAIRLPYPFMTWAQASELARRGFDLGAHTVSHPSLGCIPAGQRRSEIVESGRRIEEMTGVRPTLFAYPYGRPEDCPPAAADELAAAGFAAAVTTSRGWNGGATERFRLHRVNVTQHHDALSFPALLSGLSG